MRARFGMRVSAGRTTKHMSLQMSMSMCIMNWWGVWLPAPAAVAALCVPAVSSFRRSGLMCSTINPCSLSSSSAQNMSLQQHRKQQGGGGSGGEV